MDFNFLKNYGLFFDILNFGLNEEMREIFVVFVIVWALLCSTGSQVKGECLLVDLL